ncbi:MAG: hypothetical protein JWP57_3620, partial [Spirosoma sp.]|nr:hypothetical protein [Spirosoma sp.]
HKILPTVRAMLMHLVEVPTESTLGNKEISCMATGTFIKQNTVEAAIGRHGYQLS